MHRRSFVLTTSAVAALSLATPTIVRAQNQLRTVALDQNRLNDAFDFQNTPVWCWAACIQLVLRYYGFDITQPEIVQRTFGTVIPTTGNWIQITNNLNYIGQDSAGTDLIISGSVFLGSPSGEVIVNHLEEGKPIIMAYNNPGTFAGHAVVVTGVDYVVNWNRVEIRNIYLRDPYPYSLQHVVNRGQVHTPNVISATNTWFVDVSRL